MYKYLLILPLKIAVKARNKAADIGITFKEYLRRLIDKDLEG